MPQQSRNVQRRSPYPKFVYHWRAEQTKIQKDFANSCKLHNKRVNQGRANKNSYIRILRFAVKFFDKLW